jgi:hypothetical protein
MNECNQERCKQQIARARFQERANSITRIVIVSVGVANGITHKHLYGWLFLIGLVVHLLRIFLDQDGPGKRAYLVCVWLEILFVIVGVFALLLITWSSVDHAPQWYE